MAKGIAIFTLAALAFTGCSKSNSDPQTGNYAPIAESYAIENTKFKNCHFQFQNPTYSINVPIAPNPIQCDEGVAKKVELLTTMSLPMGLSFSNGLLSLTGTPTEKVLNAPYDFYIENEAGYLILRVAMTVK